MSFGIHIHLSPKIEIRSNSDYKKKDSRKNKTISINQKYPNLVDAVDNETNLLGINACQIFIHGPRNLRANHIDHKKMFDLVKTKNITLINHAPYNTTKLWSVTKVNSSSASSTSILNFMTDILVVTRKIGAKGLVVHLPKRSKESISETLYVLSDILNKKKLTASIAELWLEMPASKPDEYTYETSLKLNILVDQLTKLDLKMRWGMVIDTAHEYSCGVDMGHMIQWERWISELSRECRSRIRLIHLNGSEEKNFGRGKDVHIIPLALNDAIWGNLLSHDTRQYFVDNDLSPNVFNNVITDVLSSDDMHNIKNSSLWQIINFAKKNNIPLILEINRGTEFDQKLIISLIRFHLLSASAS